MTGPEPAAIVSLCTGYGGLDAAVQAATGGVVEVVAEIDPGASAILAWWHPGLPNVGDITTVDWGPWREKLAGRRVIVVAGFPCQDVSQAGARAGMRHGNRSGLWHHVLRAVVELGAELVVIENVYGLLTSRGDEPTDAHLRAEAARDAALRLEEWVEVRVAIARGKGDRDGVQAARARAARIVGARKRAVARCRWHEQRLVRAIGTVCGTLAGVGLDSVWDVVSAAEVGACHERKRVFLVAWRSDADADGGAGRRRADVEVGRPVGRAAAVGPGGDAAADGAGARPARREDGRPARGGAGEVGGGVREPERGGDGAVRDADVAARGEWREPGSGEAAGGRASADAGRPGRARVAAAADAGGDGREGAEQGVWADAGRPAAGPGRHGPARRGGPAAADAARVGRGGGFESPPHLVVDGPEHAHGGPSGGDRPAPADDSGDRREVRAELDVRPGGPGGGGTASGRHPGGRGRGDDGQPHPEDDGAFTVDWGDYGVAVRRWAAVLGRPAPCPGEPGRNGQPVLSPAFAEWMMGLPAGWVTAVPGLNKSAMLRALGNGVVPRQALAALLRLLAIIDQLRKAA